MTFDFLAMKTTSTAEKRAEKERQKEEERVKAQAIEQVNLPPRLYTGCTMGFSILSHVVLAFDSSQCHFQILL